jgi:hypothetical protein
MIVWFVKYKTKRRQGSLALLASLNKKVRFTARGHSAEESQRSVDKGA